MRFARLALTLLLSLPFVPAQAQTIDCTAPVVGQNITQGCDTSNPSSYASYSYATGAFSIAGPGQVPRIPNQMSITLEWDQTQQASIQYEVRIRNASGTIVRVYDFGYGVYMYYPTQIDINGNQTAVIPVSGWPSNWTIELAQTWNYIGQTHTDWTVGFRF